MSTGRVPRKRGGSNTASEAPAQSAREAGLRYVSDQLPGIRRLRNGSGFRYVGADGQPLGDRDRLDRIRKLAIPPAWTEVWICPSPLGHIQATGRDVRGRKQYRYHPRWRAYRDENKFSRMVALSEVLPRLRRQVEQDLTRTGLPREKVLATVVRLLEWTCIRVGNEEYARANRSFGLTTLKDQHVEIRGSRIRFEFRGKSGKVHACDISDRRLAGIVKSCQAIPGQELFQYYDEAGDRHPINSEDVNDYIREVTGGDFSAKDFRTWTGTMLAAEALRTIGTAGSAREAKSNVLKAVDQVAEQLNNTRAICRKYYIHPAIFETYTEGTLLSTYKRELRRARATGLEREEAAVLALLRSRERLAA